MAVCVNPGCEKEQKYLARGWCDKCYARFKRNGTPTLQIITNKQKGIFKCENVQCGAEGVKITKGLCKNCYYRKWHTGTADYKVRERHKCSTENCDKWAKSKGLCDTHRKRVARRGSVEAGSRPDWWGDVKAKRSRAKAARLLVNFGITIEMYNKMFVDQGGVCKTCGKPETRIDPRTGRVFPLSVDHDHATGFIRGLLCMAHNTGIGLFGDSPELLEAAAAYLRESSATQERLKNEDPDKETD